MIELIIFLTFITSITFVVTTVLKRNINLKHTLNYAESYIEFYRKLLDLANEDINELNRTIEQIRLNMETDATQNMTELERLKAINEILLKHYGGNGN